MYCLKFIDQLKGLFKFSPCLSEFNFNFGIEKICSTASYLWSLLIDQNASLVKMQPLEGSYEEPFSPITFSRAWLVYTNQIAPKIINLCFPPPPGWPTYSLSSGLNSINFYSLSELLNLDKRQPKWLDNTFQMINQKQGKQSTSIIRYESQKGKWRAKYQFFGQVAGPDTDVKKEGYGIYIKK